MKSGGIAAGGYDGAMDDSDQSGGDARDPRRGDSPQSWTDLARRWAEPQTGRDARDQRGRGTLSGRDARDVREATGRDATREDGGGKLEVVEIHGKARPAGPNSATRPRRRFGLEGTGLTLQVGTGRPIRAGYRDLSLIAIQQPTVP